MMDAIRRALVPLSLLATLLVAGCSETITDLPSFASSTVTPEAAAESPPPAEGQRMIGKPYKAAGRWFVPKDDPDYSATGSASWYGRELHGHRTANGERFDADALTAAHPTLPLPSYIRVTNLKNGKQAVLRVNDRGPFARGRLIDVSRGAADKLGFRTIGSTAVKVEYLGPAELDGGDRETLVAEAKYGVSPGDPNADTGYSLRDIIPFGRRKPKDDGPAVEVRLASVSAQDVRSAPMGDLPGVRVPARLTAVAEPAAVGPGRPGAPATAEPGVEVASLSAADKAQAYQDRDAAALDALVVMNGEETPPVDSGRKVASVAPQPVAASAPSPAATPLAEVAARDPARERTAARPEPQALAMAGGDVSTSRISGAYDLFGAIDDNTGGAGELHGVSK